MLRNLVVFCAFAATLLYGNEGEAVYKAKCASCHALYHPVSVLEKNFIQEDNELLHLKAPTINQVVYRLKTRIGDPDGDVEMQQMEIESFLEDYFANPDKSKSICLPQVLAFFDTMPKMDLSEDEFASVVEFLMAYEPADYETRKMVYRGYDKALEESKKSGNPVMVFFTAKHCHYCKKMEREVMHDAEVIAVVNSRFVPVTVEMDTEKNPTRERVTMTPTFLFLTPRERVIYKVPGSWNKEDFLEILREATEKYGKQ